MRKTIRIFINAVTTLVVGGVIILMILLVGVKGLGLQIFTVLSGSMEPTYHTGSVIYVKTVDVDALQAGDPITYYLDNDTIVTHRIVEIVTENETQKRLFRTKGDANNLEDGRLLESSEVIGKPIFSIPYLGFLVNYIQTPPGKYCAISGVLILILLVILPDLIFQEKEKGECTK